MTEPRSEEEQRKHIENLRAILAGPPHAPRPTTGDRPGGTGAGDTAHPTHRARNGVLGGLGASIVFFLSKLKVLGLLLGVLKFKTLGTMLLSIVLYATQWGAPFAIGFVLLIFVHEMGHVVVLRREGIPAGAPVFIPFLGAFIAMKGRPRDAYVEAKVGIGGPVAGSIAAWVVLAAGIALQHPLLITLGHAGILLNLFNLIPVSPLDGGRIAGAFSREFWVVGYLLGIGALVLTRSPLLLIVLVVGLFTMWQRWRHPVPGYDDIPRAKRLMVGLGYAALVIALTLTLPLGLTLHPATQ